jgi:hypothetical protein
MSHAPDERDRGSGFEATGGVRPARGLHRVAIEVEIDEDPEQPEPEDWDLEHLNEALGTGAAKPTRTIRGLVVDTDRDRLSSTLEAMADDIDDTAQLHWLAIAEPWRPIASSLRSCRPSLEVLIELEQLATATRRVAERLQQEGM